MKDFEQIRLGIENLTGSKKEIAFALLEKASFMDAQLLELQKILKSKGWVEEYQNGANQKGFKKCSEGESYISLSKIYAQVMKQLENMIPEFDCEDDLMYDFLNEVPGDPIRMTSKGKRVEKR